MAKQTARQINVKKWLKEITNLKTRIRKWEKKYGYKVDIEELKNQLDISFDVPERITTRELQQIKKINYKIYRNYAYDPNVPDDIYDDGYSTSDPIDIADHVLSELRRRIEEYQGESYTTKEGITYTRADWDYYFHKRKDDLLNLLDNGIQKYGKNNIASLAENLEEAYDLSTKYMDESKGEINQQYFRELGKLLYGRDFNMIEYARFELVNEYNGMYA